MSLAVWLEIQERSAGPEPGKMNKSREKYSEKRCLRGVRTSALALAAAIILLAASLLREAPDQSRICQLTVSLGGREYDEAFLEEAAKIKGIRQITPVLELPARIKIGDYEMDTLLQAVELSSLEKKVRAARETPLGETVVLLLGKDALSELQDCNGHTISAGQQTKLLGDFENLEVKIRTGRETSEAEGEASSKWRRGIIAGILESPAEGIYIPFEQGRALDKSAEIEKALLTVKGKDRCEKVLELFDGAAGQGARATG